MKLDNIYKEEKKSNFAKVSDIIITMASRPSGFIGLSILVFHVILASIYVSINLLADLMTLMLNPRLKTLQIRK